MTPRTRLYITIALAVTIGLFLCVPFRSSSNHGPAIGPSIHKHNRVPHHHLVLRGVPANNGTGGFMTLAGYVIDIAGNPAANARVWLSSPERSATTNERGEFYFRDVSPGNYILIARTTTEVSKAVKYRLTASSSRPMIRLELGTILSVSVRDYRGTPVRNATVRVRAMHCSSVTDALGIAAVGPLSSGWVEVEVLALGYALAREDVVIGTVQESIDFRLHPEVSVVGRVIDRDGKSVPNANIFISYPNMDQDTALEPEVRSDDSGLFRVSNMSRGPYWFVAIHDVLGAGQTPLIEIREDTPQLTILLNNELRLTGIVIDRSGSAVPNAVVRVETGGDTRGGISSRQSVTGSDGKFELVGISPSVVHVRAETATGSSAGLTVDLTRKIQDQVTLIVDDYLSISGDVVNDRGEIFGEISIHATLNDPGETLSVHATSDFSGKFTLSGLPPGNYTLSAGPERSGADLIVSGCGSFASRSTGAIPIT